jgi:hypothetical protein
MRLAPSFQTCALTYVDVLVYVYFQLSNRASEKVAHHLSMIPCAHIYYCDYPHYIVLHT